MSASEADRFIAELLSNQELAKKLTDLGSDPAAAYAEVQAQGFDVTPEELRDATLEFAGQYMDEDELEAIAGGLSAGATAGIAVGAAATGAVAGGIGVGVAIAVTGSAAAAAI